MNQHRSYGRLLAFVLALAPTSAMATPYFNQIFSPAGIALDVDNVEDRAYECTVTWDLTWVEAGRTKPSRFDQKLTIQPRWRGRVSTIPATDGAASLRTYRFDIVCN